MKNIAKCIIKCALVSISIMMLSPIDSWASLVRYGKDCQVANIVTIDELMQTESGYHKLPVAEVKITNATNRELGITCIGFDYSGHGKVTERNFRPKVITRNSTATFFVSELPSLEKDVRGIFIHMRFNAFKKRECFHFENVYLSGDKSERLSTEIVYKDEQGQIGFEGEAIGMWYSRKRNMDSCMIVITENPDQYELQR